MAHTRFRLAWHWDGEETILQSRCTDEHGETQPSLAEVNKKYGVGDRDKHRKTEGKSQAIIEGLPVCFHPILDDLEAPPRSGRCVNWIEGERRAFGLFEVPAGYAEPESESQREMFVYVLSGKIDAQANGERKTVSTGDIVYVPRGERYRLQVRQHARYAVVCSTPWLENRIDSMSAEEAEQARISLKPN